jgi:hypothetical protein
VDGNRCSETEGERISCGNGVVRMFGSSGERVCSAAIRKSLLLEPECQFKRDYSLFPSLSVRSSGGLQSIPLPGDPSRSSAGLRLGDDGVNHTSERGSVRTCARCREGKNCCNIATGGALSTNRWVLRTKLFQRKKDEAGVDSFRIDAIVSSPAADAFAQGDRL